MQTMAACMGSVALCVSHEGVNVEALGGGQFEVGLLLLGSNGVYLIGISHMWPINLRGRTSVQ